MKIWPLIFALGHPESKKLTTVSNTESYTEEIGAGEFQCSLARVVLRGAVSDRRIIHCLPVDPLPQRPLLLALESALLCIPIPPCPWIMG
jgi:hypothetical protein